MRHCGFLNLRFTQPCECILQTSSKVRIIASDFRIMFCVLSPRVHQRNPPIPIPMGTSTTANDAINRKSRKLIALRIWDGSGLRILEGTIATIIMRIESTSNATRMRESTKRRALRNARNPAAFRLLRLPSVARLICSVNIPTYGWISNRVFTALFGRTTNRRLYRTVPGNI